MHRLPCFIIGVVLCFIAPQALQAETHAPAKFKLIAAVQADFPPIYIKDPITGQPQGFAIDMMNEVARRAGIKVEYVIGDTWEESQEMVLSGRADIIPSFSVDDARRKRFSFTSTVDTLPVSYIVRIDSHVTAPKSNMLVGVMRGSIAQAYLLERKDIRLVPSDSLQKLLVDLLAGDIDIAMASAPSIVKLALDSGTDHQIRVIEPPVINGIRAMALRPGETELLGRLNLAIDQFIGTPEYRQIYFKWWGKPRPYWTTQKVAWAVAVTLVLSGLVMGYWRHASVLRLNRTLRQTLGQLEHSRENLLQSEEGSRRLAQEADQERARSQAILESIQDGISIQDRDFRVLYQNPRFIEMVGAHQGEQCYRAYHNLNEVCEGCPLEATFRDNLPHTAIMALNCLGGTLNIEILSSPLRDEQGEIKSVITTVRDLTARKQMEEALHVKSKLLEQEIAERQLAQEALQKSEHFLRTIIETEPECVKLLAADGSLQMMNSAGLKMIGADSFEQVKEASVYSLVKSEYRDAIKKLTKGVFQGIAGSLEFEIVGLKGEHLWMDTRAVPLRNSSGEIVSLLGITRDITEKRRAEEELRSKQRQLEELNLSLANRIDEAVTELRNKDQMLIQQNRLAAMGEMINNIAHQWRQPLNNIGLIVQNLQVSYEAGDLTAEDMNKEINHAMDVVMHMSRTIDDFRNFFRKDKEKSAFVINRVVSRSIDFIAATLENSNIRVETAVEDTVTAFGYQNEYAQVVLNILANAREVLTDQKVDDGCIAIRVTSDNGRSVVTIRDNGGGIAEDVLPRIFDPYFTTKAPGKGTGIGLYMSKAIVEQNMGGRLTASNVDGGAEFRIEV